MVGVRAFHAIGIHGDHDVIVGCSRLYTCIGKTEAGNETAVHKCCVRSARYCASINVVPGDR